MTTRTINISIPDKLLREIDKTAQNTYQSRSDVIKQASLRYIDSQRNFKLLQVDLAQKAKKLGIKNEDDIEDLIDESRS